MPRNAEMHSASLLQRQLVEYSRLDERKFRSSEFTRTVYSRQGAKVILFQRPPSKGERMDKNEKIGLRIEEAAELAGLGRTSLYAAIKNGHLAARKSGCRTVVLRHDLEAYLERLPRVARAEKRNSFDSKDDGNA